MARENKNALARSQRQFYNEYEKALMDSERELPTAQEVVQMFAQATQIMVKEGLKHAV